MKKFILLMLAVALVALPVLSCATDDGADPTDPVVLGDPGYEPGRAAEPGEDVTGVPAELTFPDLPDVNFGGYDFRILNSVGLGWILIQLVAEEETGEALNDAIFRRNRRMEERFGFNLVQTDFTGPGPVRDSARRSIQAASDDFDMAMMQPYHGLSLAQDGLLEMIDTVPHIDLSAPWWDQDMNRDYSIGHRLFFTSGDFSFNQYSVTVTAFFNKQLHEDLGLDCPYTLVHEGRWTLERFAEQGRAGNRDLNGDGVMDATDQWGLVSNPQAYTIGFPNGVGARFVTKDEHDLPVLNVNTQGFIDRFNIIFDMLMEGWHMDGHRAHTRGEPMNLFRDGRALFWIDLMNWASILRAVDDDFGILPLPKLNEQQPYHIHGTGIPHVMTVPITTADLDRTGIILEALNAESRLTTREVYFDTVLVNQIMNRDEESAEMLDIIFANRVYEIGRQFWNDQIQQPILQAFTNMNRDIASIIERNEPAALAAMQRTVDAFLGNN